MVAVAVAAPAHAASTSPDLQCVSGDPDVSSVYISGNLLVIQFTPNARNSVDVTIRQKGGAATIHYNLVPPGTPTNNVPHMKNYTPGGSFTIPLTFPYNRETDWFQVKTIHNENCVEV